MGGLAVITDRMTGPKRSGWSSRLALRLRLAGHIPEEPDPAAAGNEHVSGVDI